MKKQWIGVDLDGTLAKIDGWKGTHHIGEPIQPMVDKVKKLLASGKIVKIMTARAADADEKTISIIKKWCKTHIGQELEITNKKDMYMVALFDDKAIRVEKNTGKLM
jgi:archaellum biogenesis ATPase FlaH